MFSLCVRVCLFIFLKPKWFVVTKHQVDAINLNIKTQLLTPFFFLSLEQYHCKCNKLHLLTISGISHFHWKYPLLSVSLNFSIHTIPNTIAENQFWRAHTHTHIVPFHSPFVPIYYNILLHEMQRTNKRGEKNELKPFSALLVSKFIMSLNVEKFSAQKHPTTTKNLIIVINAGYRFN